MSRRKAGGPAKPPGKCIFCEGGDLTKQHVWPDMLGKVIPRVHSEHNQARSRFRTLPGRLAVLQLRVDKRQGDIGVKKLRNCCRTCNNEWIGGIEGRIKPVLFALIKGDSLTLAPREQSDLALWISIVASVAEFTDRETMAITQAERLYIREEERPPENWLIAVARYSGDSKGDRRYRHRGLEATDANLPVVRGRCNIQISTFVLGAFVAHAVSARPLGLVIDGVFDIAGQLPFLWPHSERTLDWSMVPALDDAATDRLSDSLFFTMMKSGLPDY